MKQLKLIKHANEQQSVRCRLWPSEKTAGVNSHPIMSHQRQSVNITNLLPFTPNKFVFYHFKLLQLEMCLAGTPLPCSPPVGRLFQR